MKKIILQIDGGGIRGVLAVALLRDISLNYKDISIVTGTSTGGIIAALISAKYSYDDIIDFYKKETKQVFKKQFNLLGISNKYSIDNLKDSIYKYFNNSLFNSLNIPVIVPSYNLTKGEVKLFKSTKDSDDTIIDALCSTAAAPTYFNPYKYKDSYMIDGGIYANCSAQIALNELLSQKESLNNIILISIGTGNYSPNIDLKNPTLIQYLTYKGMNPLIDSTIDGGTDCQIYNLKQLTNVGLEFYRLQLEIPKELYSMDNVDNINKLIDFANQNKSIVDTLNNRLKDVIK